MDEPKFKLIAVCVAAVAVIVTVAIGAVTGNGKEYVAAALNVLATALQGFK